MKANWQYVDIACSEGTHAFPRTKAALLGPLHSVRRTTCIQAIRIARYRCHGLILLRKTAKSTNILKARFIASCACLFGVHAFAACPAVPLDHRHLRQG
jgi:hypothetical protein